jgi:hypothetical protein
MATMHAHFQADSNQAWLRNVRSHLTQQHFQCSLHKNRAIIVLRLLLLLTLLLCTPLLAASPGSTNTYMVRDEMVMHATQL